MNNKNPKQLADDFRAKLVKGLLPIFIKKIEDEKTLMEHELANGNGLVKTPEQQRVWEEDEFSKLTKRYEELYEAGYRYFDPELSLTHAVAAAYTDAFIANRLDHGVTIEDFKVNENWTKEPLPLSYTSFKPSISYGSGTETLVHLPFRKLTVGFAIQGLLNERTQDLMAEPESLPGPVQDDKENSSEGLPTDSADAIAQILTFPVPAEKLIDELQKQVNCRKILADAEDITKLVRHTFNFSDDPINKVIDKPSKKLQWVGTQAGLVGVFAQFYPGPPSVKVRDTIADMLKENFVIVGVPGNPSINEDTLKKALRDFGYGGKVKTVKKAQRSKKE